MDGNAQQEEKQLKKRILDLLSMSERNTAFYFTDFLVPAEYAAAYAALREAGIPADVIPRKMSAFGGTEGCERVMLRFGDPDEFGYEVPFPLKTIKIEPLNAKFADVLTHRDVLGALMHTGIRRDVIGDILVRPDSVYVFAKDTIAAFLCEELTRIRHTVVRLTVLDEAPADAEPQIETMTLNVASERLDAVIAKLYNLSRADAKALLSGGQVMNGGRVVENESMIPKDGDIISVRGYGKFVYQGMLHETRKGRLAVAVGKYV